ncbi:ATP-dependent RNA helicase dhx29, partial [Borealophlyctis nickersoniae]
MPPKKKKKAFPGAQRGYATTSIIKEKQPVQEEQNHEGEPQPSLPQDHPHPTASEQVPVLPPADTTIATPSSTWEDETPLEPVTNLSKDFASIARAAALRVDQELSRDEHKRNDIARDRSIPQLKLGQDAEKDMVQFLKDRGVVDTFEQTLTVAPKPERNVENQAQQPVPAKDDAVSFSTQTPAVESSAAESSPAKTKIDASLKSWILNNAQDDVWSRSRYKQILLSKTFNVATIHMQDSDSDTPSDSPPAPPQPTPSEQYARLRLELEHLKAAASAAKRDKDAKAQKQAGARVREVNELLKALERAGCVDWKEEERVYRELNKGEVESGEKGAEVGEGVDVDVVGGGDVEGEVEGKGGDEVPGKDGGDGQAEPTVETPDANQDEQDDDGGFLGAMFTDPPPTSTSPSQPPASTSTTTPAPTIRDMSVTKWTGRTPKQLLQDWTSKNARGARISYFSIKGGAGDRAGVRFSGGKGKVAVDAVVVEMDAGERVKGRKDAEEFVATKALYHFASQLSLHRSLPPPFRDLWMEWVDAEKNAAEQTRQTIEEEGMQRILQLAEHRQKLIDERQAKTPTLTTSDPTPLSSQTDAASSTSDDETTRTAVSRALKDELQKRRSQSSYKELLNQRRSLPVYAMKDELVKLVNEHRVMIVSGETGSGKSTQIPQFLLETAIDGGSGGSCNPRRISATSIATRVSEEMGDGAGGGRVGSNGAWVGYQVRLESRVSKSTRLNFCTTGVLLRRLESDGHLHGVTHVVVDEVHERSLDSDFLVLLLRRILVRRADIKVILMSATADAQLFATYFAGVPGIGHVPCVEVPGRTFPVTTYYMEDAVEDTGYKIEPGSEYAIKASMRMRDAGNLTVSGKGGKKYTVRLRWEEVVDGADYDEDEDDDDTDQPQPDTEDPDSDSSLTPPPRTYSKSTHRTLALSDPRKINLDLVERV